MGWRFYQWGKVAAQLGRTAAKWEPRWGGSELSENEPAVYARDLAVKLKHWLRRYHGVSTRWLRGYLALFAQLHEEAPASGSEEPAMRPSSIGTQGPGEPAMGPSAIGTPGPTEPVMGPSPTHRWSGLPPGTEPAGRSRWARWSGPAWWADREGWVRLAGQLAEISVRSMEGPGARRRRAWVK